MKDEGAGGVGGLFFYGAQDKIERVGAESIGESRADL